MRWYNMQFTPVDEVVLYPRERWIELGVLV